LLIKVAGELDLGLDGAGLVAQDGGKAVSASALWSRLRSMAADKSASRGS